MKSSRRKDSAPAAAGSNLFRRRNNRLDLLTDFKNDLDTSKDIYQLIREQMLADTQSPWHGYELLYVVVINKKKKGNAPQQSISVSSERSTGFSLGKQERYLALLKRPESATGFSLLRVIKKDNELEFKSSLPLPDVKSLDYGSEDMELLISMDTQEHSIFFNSQGDRDETLWILMQVTRLVVGSDVSIGYSVDVDGLQYMIANNGIFARFPQLQKVITLSTAHLQDQFTADEAEAEQILDEIDWSSSLQGQKGLQAMLSQRSEKLNNDIIDFLLQWEENDESSMASANSKAKLPQSSSQGALSSFGASSKANAAPSSSAGSTLSGLRDTREVLAALALVDDELHAVEMWLGDQIKKLSNIRGNLSLIEDESGTLETSWQNLNIVEQVIAQLVGKYSFTSSEESLLRSPDTVIGSVLKSSTLSTMDQLLQPLLAAGRRLRTALVVKPVELHGLTANDWKQIQAIAAISERKEQLMNIADNFCSKFGEVALTLFDRLLKHKALVEGESSSSKSPSAAPSSTIILPKAFNSKPLFEEVSYSLMWIDASKFFLKRNNILLDSLQLYHNHLIKFVDLLDLQAELASASSRALCEAYVRATYDRLYQPLIKAFVKDLQSLVSYKQSPISMSTASRYRIGGKNELLVCFHQSENRAGQPKVLTSWKAFEVALLMLSPIVVSEEAFIRRMFHLDGRKAEVETHAKGVSLAIDEVTFTQSRLHAMLTRLFDGATDRMLSLSSSNSSSSTLASGAATAVVNATLMNSVEAHDGVENIAMLSVLSHYAESYAEAMQSMAEDSQRSELCSSGLYMLKLIKKLQDDLEQLINIFANEQIAWIQSQRADLKSANVLLPFVRFPFLVMHVVHMTHGKTFEAVDALLVKITRELLSWLGVVTKQSDKYGDKIRLVNLTFFIRSLGELNVPCLQQFTVYAEQQLQESSSKYVNWMVEYELPSLSALAVRIDGIGRKLDSEDLSLYIRRKDVLSVIKELDSKSLDSFVANLAKRIEKHLKSDNDAELNLLPTMWLLLKDRIVGIFTKLETVASASYQINLDVKPSQISTLFDQHKAVLCKA